MDLHRVPGNKTSAFRRGLLLAFLQVLVEADRGSSSATAIGKMGGWHKAIVTKTLDLKVPIISTGEREVDRGLIPKSVLKGDMETY